jgi:DNA adenine methylase
MHTHPAPRTSKPFLKWAGGKSRVLASLLPHLPCGGRLIEPFVGAGSVFLGTDYAAYVINDANSDLVATWAALQARPQEYVERASALFVPSNLSAQAYGRIRSDFNACTDRFERAIRLPYLNKFGFNGLFRVNGRGDFNVPYGKPAQLPRFPLREMEDAAAKLSRCAILNGDFAAAIALAGVGDVVYCDPPYSARSPAGSFTGYTALRFDQNAHERLLECCVQAVSRGARVVISNHDTPEVRTLYRGWHIESLFVRRSIGASAASRKHVAEVVAMLPRCPTSTEVSSARAARLASHYA